MAAATRSLPCPPPSTEEWKTLASTVHGLQQELEAVKADRDNMRAALEEMRNDLERRDRRVEQKLDEVKLHKENDVESLKQFLERLKEAVVPSFPNLNRNISSSRDGNGKQIKQRPSSKSGERATKQTRNSNGSKNLARNAGQPAAAPEPQLDEGNLPTQPEQTHRLKRKRVTGCWTVEAMEMAMDEVDKGLLSERAASRKYRIPRTSLSAWRAGTRTSKRKGPPTVLTSEEEQKLVIWIEEQQRAGHPVSKKMLRQKVAELAKGRSTPFNGGIPGPSWWKGFQKRHPELTFRAGEALEALGVQPDSTNQGMEDAD